MEVTKKNFEELLPEILKDIRDSAFVSLDTELTGLWYGAEPRALDPPHQVYEMYLNNASNFIVIQIGLSLFKYDPSTKSYTCKTYNFYTFPRPLFRNDNYAFSCQASAIDFLVEHKFDFNKTFYEGISYLNLEKESKMSKILEERRFFKEKNADKEYEKIDIPPEHKDTVNDACVKLGSVLSENAEETEVRVAGLNGFVRRLVYQTIKERYPKGELTVETKEGALVGRRTDGENKETRTQLEIDQDTINKAKGFSKVIQELSKSGKLIVGHNMLLDLLHIIHHFLCYLPPSYEEFKSLLKGTFPWIIDTKYVSTGNRMKDVIASTQLEQLFNRLANEPFAHPLLDKVEGYDSTDKNLNKFHDAGYDSFVTGSCFISLFNFLANPKTPQSNANVWESSKTPSAKLKKFINRVFMQSSIDHHLVTDGPDPEPDRSHYFHVVFPKKWVTGDIHSLFSPYGHVTVYWLNDTSAWVGLMNPKHSFLAKSVLCSKSGVPPGVTVLPYSQAACLVSAPKKRSSDGSHSSSPHPKKRRSSRESNVMNRSTIETIPEENEDEEDCANGKVSSSSTPKQKGKKRHRSSASAGDSISELEKGAEDNDMAVTGSDDWN